MVNSIQLITICNWGFKVALRIIGHSLLRDDVDMTPMALAGSNLTRAAKRLPFLCTIPPHPIPSSFLRPFHTPFIPALNPKP